MSIHNEVWAAVAHVKAKPGNEILQGATGAFTAVVVLAEDEQDANAKINTKLATYDLNVERLEDVGLLTQHEAINLPTELLTLAETLTQENPVAFGKFHLYRDS
jgi:hypothetical protein